MSESVWVRRCFFGVLLGLFLIGADSSCLGQEAAEEERQADESETSPWAWPVSFVPNQGSWNPSVRYVSVTPQGRLFLMDDGVRIQSIEALGESGEKGARHYRISTLFLDFRTSSGDPALASSFEALEPEQRRWFRPTSSSAACAASGFSKIRYREVYPGIDIEIYRHGEGFEYDLILHQGARIEDVRLEFRGADEIHAGPDGKLQIKVGEEVFWQTAPCCFTKERGFTGEGGAKFRQTTCTLRWDDDFAFGFERDEEKRENEEQFVIDPGVMASTWVGGSLVDFLYDVEVLDDGSVVAVGETASLDFPVSPGVIEDELNGATDGFVCVLEASLQELRFATFLGGSGDETLTSVGVDSEGGFVVAGWTSSSDFPVTLGSFGEVFSGGGDRGTDAVVARISPLGDSMTWAGFLGGMDDEILLAAQLTASDEVIVVGATASSDFPTTGASYDPTFNGLTDMFVTKVMADGSTIEFSTLMGGTEEEEVHGIDIDSVGDIWLTGRTYSPNFPVTANAYDPSMNGSFDVVAMKLSENGDQLLYSSFFGGPRRDEGKSIACDPVYDEVYVTGVARSPDFPTTPGVYGEDLAGHYDAFVIRLQGNTYELMASTLVGGETTDDALSVTVDDQGRPTIAGYTWSTQWPTSMGAYDRSHGGIMDGFVARFDRSLEELEYSSLIGGVFDDIIYSLDWLPDGSLLMGGTSRLDFPVTPGAYDEVANGVELDGFLTAFEPLSNCPAMWIEFGVGWPGTLGVPTLEPQAPPVLCEDFPIQLVNSSSEPAQALLFRGITQDSTETPLGGTLWVIPNSVVSLMLPVGELNLNATLPCDEAFCGLSVYMQLLVVDPGASSGVAFSAGLELQLGSRP